MGGGGVGGVGAELPQRCVRDDFYASLVLADGDNIEITHKNMHRNSCTSLPAYSSGSSFELAPHGNAIHQSVGWSPKASCGWPHRYLAAVSGSGRRSRRSRRARNSRESRESSSEAGRAVKMRAANGPACESSKAAEEASRCDNTHSYQTQHNYASTRVFRPTCEVRLFSMHCCN